MTELALEQTLDLGDYLAAFRRRKGLILTVAGIVFLALHLIEWVTFICRLPQDKDPSLQGGSR